MRQPGPHTLVPDTVISKLTGETIEVKANPILTALMIAIAEDFMAPTRGGVPDIVSAASDAKATLDVVAAAGLRIFDPDAAVFPLPNDYDGEDGHETIVTIHCFFRCPHVEQAGTPRAARAAMQEHYSRDHAEALATFLGRAVDRPAPDRNDMSETDLARRWRGDR